MEYLKPFHIIINWLLKLLNIRTKKEKEKVQRVIEYIDSCLEHLKIIINYDEKNESKTEYSRNFLQSTFNEVSDHLSEIATKEECDIIQKSLMSGRIYYHAAKYGKVSDEQVKSDYEGRLNAYINNTYDQKEFRQNSNEPILRALIKDGQVISSENREYELKQIKCVCREDIQRIESLRERLKSRKVLI